MSCRRTRDTRPGIDCSTVITRRARIRSRSRDTILQSCDDHVILRKELGSLRLKVQCREERILDSQFYTPFVEFMLAAVEEKKVGHRSLTGTAST